ncbi:MAG: chemotaxis protein CheC [Promethearchaeota archaeon]
MNKNNKNLVRLNEYKLTREQLDTLKELGNIGSGHAITALSKLLNSEIEVSLTSAEIIPFWKVPEVFDTPQVEVFGVYSEVSYNLKLSIIQIFTKESLINLINLLNFNQKIPNEEIVKVEDLDDISLSIIKEIGNILTGHYTTALADLLSTQLIPNVPTVALDTLQAMLNGIIAKYSRSSDFLIIIQTKITLPEINLNCIMCSIPCINILKTLFKTLNLKYDINL